MRLFSRCALLVSLASPALARADVVAIELDHTRAVELSAELDRELAGFGHRVLLVADAEAGADAEVVARTSGARVLITTADASGVHLRARALEPNGATEDASLPRPLDDVPARVFASVAGSAALHVLRSPMQETATPAAAAATARIPYETFAAPRAVPTSAVGPSASRPFFVRAAGVLGLPYVTSGQEPDRSITPTQLERAAPDGASADEARDQLRREGFDCTVSEDSAGVFIAQDCALFVDGDGFSMQGAVAIEGGFQATRRLAVSLGARVTPRAGRGALARTLIGANVEYELLRPSEEGFSLRVLGGPGVGRIQARPGARGPYATSGLFEVHGGLVFGYRFVPALGVFSAVTVRRLFPVSMTALDMSLGVSWSP